MQRLKKQVNNNQIDLLRLENEEIRLDIHTKNTRTGRDAYFFVNDSGNARSPNEKEQNPYIYEHIDKKSSQCIKTI